METDFFTKGIVEIINEESLKSRLSHQKPLRIKYGVDPTRPDIHLGHAVQLWKLQQLQEAGHTVIFLIGDFTTKIGDPSGRNTTRPILSDEEIKANAKSYFEQVGKILDVRQTEVRYNSEWFSKMKFDDLIKLAGKFTVAQIIERDDFEKRLKAGQDISFYETLYPLMQAYDSVELQADVEFGGSDQKFNLLAGRDLQRKMGQVPQEVIMTKLLVGTDGKIKMSKSAGNYISITEEPSSMFGKIMSIPDDVIMEYFELGTNLTLDQIEKFRERLAAGENPRDIKLILAEKIVGLYHGEEAAQRAKNEFIEVFSRRSLPTDIPEISIPYGNYSPELLLINLGAVSSNSEARRLIEQGALRINEAKVTDPKSSVAIEKGMIIQLGRLKFYKIK